MRKFGTCSVWLMDPPGVWGPRFREGGWGERDWTVLTGRASGHQRGGQAASCSAVFRTAERIDLPGTCGSCHVFELLSGRAMIVRPHGLCAGPAAGTRKHIFSAGNLACCGNLL